MKRVAIIYRNIAGLSGTPNTIIDHATYVEGAGQLLEYLFVS